MHVKHYPKRCASTKDINNITRSGGAHMLNLSDTAQQHKTLNIRKGLLTSVVTKATLIIQGTTSTD